MPTSFPLSTTGRRRILCMSISFWASRIRVSGVPLMTLVLIYSLTYIDHLLGGCHSYCITPRMGVKTREACWLEGGRLGEWASLLRGGGQDIMGLMRIIIFTGKGGVGKTTVAAASALR